MRLTKEELKLILHLVEARRIESYDLTQEKKDTYSGTYKVMYETLCALDDKLLAIINSPLPVKKITIV